MFDKRVFAENLKYYMSKHNETQDEVAKLLGVSKSNVSAYVNASQTPRMDKVAILCDHYNINFSDLLERHNTSHAHGTQSPDSLGNTTSATAETSVLSGLSPEAVQLAKDYDELDAISKRAVRTLTDVERERTIRPVEIVPHVKQIYLMENRFAAGAGEPDFGNFWGESYTVPADSPAEFAIRISGDSMEPYLPDGSIQLCLKRTPKDGEVGAFLIDGEFVCKQCCVDVVGTLHLFSLNRARRDYDRHIPRDEIQRQILCFGTVIMKRVPLPRE